MAPCRPTPRRSVAEFLRRRRQVAADPPAGVLGRGDHRLLGEGGAGEHPDELLTIDHERVFDCLDGRGRQVVLLVEAFR